MEVVAMQECRDKVIQWLTRLEGTSAPGWDELPGIELYMDQVLTMLERQSSGYRAKDDARSLTASMVNNYVKDGTIQRPVKKKYNKDHIANLIMLDTAKQVLPISDISKLLNAKGAEISTEEKYRVYLKLQKEACESVAEKVHEAMDYMGDQCDSTQMFMLASKLALEANIMVSASKMLIREILTEPEEKAEGKKAPAKKAQKAKAEKKKQ